MSYSTNEEIIAEFKSIDTDSADSIITPAKLDAFRLQDAGLINSHVSAKYATPVPATSVDAYQMLKKIEIDLVSYRIVKIMNIKKAITASNGVIQEILEGTAYRDAKKLLVRISKGDLPLPGLDTIGVGAFGSYAVKNKQEPIMKKERKQW